MEISRKGIMDFVAEDATLAEPVGAEGMYAPNIEEPGDEYHAYLAYRKALNETNSFDC